MLTLSQMKIFNKQWIHIYICIRFFRKVIAIHRKDPDQFTGIGIQTRGQHLVGTWNHQQAREGCQLFPI
jgi:hypothetical protein